MRVKCLSPSYVFECLVLVSSCGAIWGALESLVAEGLGEKVDHEHVGLRIARL